jgi:hypothetical protein
VLVKIRAFDLSEGSEFQNCSARRQLHFHFPCSALTLHPLLAYVGAVSSILVSVRAFLCLLGLLAVSYW